MNDKADKRVVVGTAVGVFCLYYSFLLLLPGSSLLADPDTFWHIRVGQWILDHAQFPTVGIFSYTAANKPWTPTEWLSEIIFALAFNLGGLRVVVILADLVCAAMVGLLCYYLLRHLRFSVAVGWTALAAVIFSNHFLARPHIFAYVVLLIWMVKLLDDYDRNNFDFSSLLFFVPLMVLWANLHGSFTFGLMLLDVFAGLSFFENMLQRDYAKSWRIATVIIAVTLGALLTPYGIHSALETVRTVKMSYTNHHINEMMPPDFQSTRIILLLFIGLLAILVSSGIKLRGPRLIAFCIIIAMALSYVRGLAMFFLLSPILLMQPLAGCSPYFVSQFSNKISLPDEKFDPILSFLQKRITAVCAVFTTIAATITATAWARTDFRPPDSMGQAAIDFVQRSKVEGNVFNSYGFGGFLIFSGIPVFIDGRAPLYGDEFIKEYFATIALSNLGEAFHRLDEYKITWTLLMPSSPLANALSQSPEWDKLYSDKNAIVFTRRRS